MTHEELAANLAIAKGGIPFLNVCLGSAWKKGKTPRADLVICNPSYNKFLLSIFEVKISRSDFLSDLRNKKWELYLEHCHRFYFAALDGVCCKKDIPEAAGLILFKEKGWTVAKAAPRLQSEIPQETLLSLIFARQRQTVREKRLEDIKSMNKRGYRVEDFMGRVKAARVHGNEVASLLASVARLNGGIQDAIRVLDLESTRRHAKLYGLGHDDTDLLTHYLAR